MIPDIRDEIHLKNSFAPRPFNAASAIPILRFIDMFLRLRVRCNLIATKNFSCAGPVFRVAGPAQEFWNNSWIPDASVVTARHQESRAVLPDKRRSHAPAPSAAAVLP
jgi:hypothetical protein